MMEIITSITPAVATAICGLAVWRIKSNDKTKTWQNRALTLLLRRELREIHEAAAARGYVTTGEYSAYIEIYDVYHSLGGNGVATKWRDDLDSMDMREG